jgi:hypothetical protein
MVMPDIKITPPGVGIQVPGYRTGVNTPPRRSNQTPEGPANPMPLLVSQFPGVQQRIKTWYPHTTPNIDNYQGEHNYANAQPWQTGIRQRMKTMIPTNLPPNVNPGSYINESINNPHGIKTVGITGSTGYPRQIITMSIPGPRPIKQVGYGEQPWRTGIRQHMNVPITQIVPPGVYPDTYGKKQMSYDGASTFLLGGILGFTLGAILFTATGRKVASAAGQRAAQYIGPKS